MGVLAILITQTPPDNFIILVIFFILFTVDLFYLLVFILNHRRRAAFIALGITFVFILRALDLKHWLYPLLITALILSTELYIHNQSLKQKR